VGHSPSYLGTWHGNSTGGLSISKTKIRESWKCWNPKSILIVPFSQIASMFRGVGAGGTNWVLLQARLVSPVLPVATSLPWRRRVIIGGLCRIAKTPI
jgi:hypothetical protein